MAPDAAATRSRPPRTVGVALLVVAAGYSWVAGHFTTFTRPAEIATFVPGLVGMVVALRIRPSPTGRPGRSGRGWLAWWLIVIAVTAIELAELALGSTHRHPTLSDLVNPWLLASPSRAVAFLLWLGFGYWLSRR